MTVVFRRMLLSAMVIAIVLASACAPRTTRPPMETPQPLPRVTIPVPPAERPPAPVAKSPEKPTKAAPTPITDPGQRIAEFRGGDGKTVGKRYLVHLPPGYAPDGEEWPLILYLHGASVRGSDPEALKKYGMPLLVEQKKDFPFIVVSPQCPKGILWHDPVALGAFLDEVMREYRVDPTRVYLTGVSMGGEGAWLLAATYPERFAAIAPLCGRADTTWATRLQDVPVWVFHGLKDTVCPISFSFNMVNAVIAAGGQAKYTFYPEDDHDIVTRTYALPELFDWFRDHRRAPR